MTKLLRVSVAIVWMVTGLGVVFPSYRAVGHEYLSALGLPDALMYVACVLEVGLAVFLLVFKPTKIDAIVQIAAVAFFTVTLSIIDPMLMVHPYGVLSKNIPLVCCVIAAMWETHRIWILRIGIAAIWIAEGLFPKIFFQQQWEVDVVASSGLVPCDPSSFLILMGIAEALSGAFILIAPLAKFAKPVLMIQLLLLVVLPLLITIQDPSVWVHPFGPMVKNVPIIGATLFLVVEWY